MALPIEPTSGCLALKIKSREDARQVAESLLPLSNEDNHDKFFMAAARDVLSEVIVALNLMFPRIWRLRNLALIVSHPFSLRIFLQKTPRGRELLDRYFNPLTPEITSAIVAILTKCLH